MGSRQRLPPATVAALAWCAGIAGAAGGGRSAPAAGAAAAVLAAGILPAAIFMRPAWPVLALAGGLLGVARAEIPTAHPAELSRAQALAGRTVVLEGVVVDDPRPSAAGFEVLVQPSPGGYGAVLVRVRGPGETLAGDTVEARGRLHLPADAPGFDRRAYLAQRGAHLELAATDFQVQRPGGLRGLPGWLRDGYRSAIEALLPPPHSAVLVGIVLGIRSGIPRSLEQDLIATGLVHLLVLSGLKVAVFARLVTAALSPVLGRSAALPAVALIALYALVGGATPAAVRAAAMGSLALLAGRLGRPTHVWTSLAMTAAAMLGWRPELAWDVGFQLSFLGTAAIVLLTPGIERRLGFLPPPLREPFAVTCAAQVGTVPVMAQGFHVLSPIAPLANAAVLPLLPLLVGAGLLAAPASLLPAGLGAAAALPLAAALAYVEQVATLLARVPAAAVPVPSFPAWAGAAYYLGLGAALVAARVRGRGRALAVAATVVLPLALTAAETLAWMRPPPSVAFLAVGDGQAVLLTGPSGRVLVDGGPSPARLAAELGARLPPWQHDLDALVITGPSLGEVGGLAGFQRGAAAVLVPDAPVPGTAWRGAALAEVARGAVLRPAAAGDEFDVAGLRIDVLAPASRNDPAGALALRIARPGGRSVCLLGALDIDGQAQAGVRLREGCDYLLVPQGGRSLPAPELLAAAHPSVLVVSAGPSARLARGLPEAGLRRTDQEGTITLDL